MRDRLFVAAVAATLLLPACSGGGGSSFGGPTGSGSGSSGGSGSSTSSATRSASAIADTNALGSPVSDFVAFDNTSDLASVASGAAASAVARVATAAATATGACKTGVEFFAPDKAGDANSTETIDFYDAGCTQEARDRVRVYTTTSASSETVNATESLYAVNNTTPIATRSSSHSITNATFNQYGFPIASDGYDLAATSALNIAGSRTIVSDREFVLAPASASGSTFCADSAGYNATGFTALEKTYGWQGGVLAGGTRVVNADHSVTWTATHAGTAYTAAIGSLSIATGTQNTTCPISTPAYTLEGGTAIGTYSIPIVVTYAHGMVESLTVSNATLTNGDTLNVTTNTSTPPSSNQFITGILSNGGTQIATFAVDAYGDGTLTVTSSGAQFVITNWHVVR